MDDKINTAAEALEEQTLPRVHAACANQDGSIAIPTTRPKQAAKPKSASAWAYERLILYIKNFEEQLDNEHEVAMGFTGADAGVIRIEGIGYFDPDIVTFYGSDPTGTKTQLIQHVTQLNVMLRALPKKVASEAPQRIGFRLAADLETE